MGANREAQAASGLYAVLETAPAWDERLAWWVSKLGSPPVLTVAAMLLCAYAADTSSAWAWASLSMALAVLLPALYVLWLVRRGRVSDFDLYHRRQRLGPFVVTIISTGATWFLLQWSLAPLPLRVLTGAGCVQAALLLAITLRWKISVHSAAAAGLVMIAWLLFATAALPFALLLPLVAWSRLRLGRHTLPQTLAGTALGSVVFGVAWLIGGI
jgi:membrane-associated phospholipid phosphatase